jgi:hypothetical protein
MGLSENWVLPRLLDLAMRNRVLGSYRRSAITSARGLVLEIGVGSGLNLLFYGPAADRVVGLDPRPEASAISPVSTEDHRFRHCYSLRCVSAWRKGWLETVKIPPNGWSRSKMTKIAELIESAASAIIT